MEGSRGNAWISLKRENKTYFAGRLGVGGDRSRGVKVGDEGRDYGERQLELRRGALEDAFETQCRANLPEIYEDD